ncbi:biotin--[acetyl-CoA-carboxylase] ligase [Leptolyngbya sp. FACHB-17]|uniref:biotin--[acetyl-CoA-carboxylase] ligase n=2 Tax=unclassified Leptolyngbya TaxID=2650499 RepID=UPI0018EFFEE2|nr:biotin--[acetyl-CoA-carboxylase] ligase [Leptolyngbya sp. FACHB-17]
MNLWICYASMDKKRSQPDKQWLIELESCESTNSWALEQLSQLQHGDVVFTHNQTAGRGQFDRAWVSSSGALTASFVLNLPIAQLAGLSLIAGLATIDAIETLSPNLHGTLGLKWTNDVFAEGRKLAGVLCESRIQAEQAQVVVGIGINCEPVPVDGAISLQEISAYVPDLQALLEQLQYCLLQLCNRSLVELLPEIQARDILQGKTIVFDAVNEQLTGVGAGIDEQGRLLIQLADGIRAYRSGRVLSID